MLVAWLKCAACVHSLSCACAMCDYFFPARSSGTVLTAPVPQSLGHVNLTEDGVRVGRRLIQRAIRVTPRTRAYYPHT